MYSTLRTRGYMNSHDSKGAEAEKERLEHSSSKEWDACRSRACQRHDGRLRIIDTILLQAYDSSPSYKLNSSTRPGGWTRMSDRLKNSCRLRSSRPVVIVKLPFTATAERRNSETLILESGDTAKSIKGHRGEYLGRSVASFQILNVGIMARSICSHLPSAPMITRSWTVCEITSS